jgi:hypothetical protein
MQNTPELFDAILNGSLRPGLPDNNPDEIFIPLLSSLKLIETTFANKFEIDFVRPFNAKTKYYNRLITSNANKYCNEVIMLIDNESDKQIKKYWISDTLQKKLKSRLIKVGEVIKNEGFELSLINSRYSQFHQDTDHKTNTYIIQLLKVALIKCYLEIQDQFSEWIDDQLIETDFYTQLLFETVPDSFNLKTVERMIIPESIPENEPIVEEQQPEAKVIEFIPKQSDFKGKGKSPVQYSDIRNPELFSKFEIELFESSLINEEYNFNDKHGNKNLLAALYIILIEKNYFRRTNTRNSKPFEPHHFRQYLDHRYNVDTTQQFKKCTKEQIASFKYKHTWVDNIDFCR